jgi:hypothetical protein
VAPADAFAAYGAREIERDGDVGWCGLALKAPAAASPALRRHRKQSTAVSTPDTIWPPATDAKGFFGRKKFGTEARFSRPWKDCGPLFPSL